MSKNNSRKLVYSESEAESGSDESKDETKLLDECDDENEEHFEERQNIASSTQIESKAETKDSVKLQLARALRDIGVQTRPKRALKTITWSKVKIDGYDKVELQKELDEIIKAVGTIRTLDEILADFEVNHRKYEFSMHPDHPTKPTGPLFAYIKDHRTKIEKQMEKHNPGDKIAYTDLVKFASSKYNNLPDSKKDVYINRYKEEKEEYKLKMQEFFAEHPEMKPKRGMKAKALKALKAPKVPKVKVVKVPRPQKLKILTPFSCYREELSKNGNPVKNRIAQQMWKDLPNEEKGSYIANVVSRVTDREKKISKEEMKILEHHTGLPVRPVRSAYNRFVTNFRKTYEGNMKEFIKTASAEWKKVDKKERAQLQKEVDKSLASWKKKMQAYISDLPPKQQGMMSAKYNIFQTPKKKVTNGQIETESDSDAQPSKKMSKRKLEVSSDEESQLESNKSMQKGVESESDVSPSKKKKKKTEKTDESSQELSPIQTPTLKKKKKIEKTDESSQELSPIQPSTLKKKKKSQKTDEDNQELSPIKAPSPKKQKMRLPEFPPQTTAYYFMTKVYEGKPSKVAKAYRKLDQKQKAQYHSEMKMMRANFLSEAQKYLAADGSDEAKDNLQKMVKELKKKQIEELAWHEDNETDVEKPKKVISSDSESDSDSS